MNGGTSIGTPQLPNPFTPIAWLSPDVGTQFDNVQYLLLGVLGAWIWDVLMSLPQEYSVLFVASGYKVKLPDVVYVLSRMTTGGFIITAVVLSTPPVSLCHAVSKLQVWFAAIQFPTNALLFFFRIRGVFFDEPLIIALFGLLWVGVAATNILSTFYLDGFPIGNSGNCANTRLGKVGTIGIVLTAVNDTLVFVAITTRLLLLSHSGPIPWSARARSFLTGQGMGPIMRAMLQTGQLYYMTTVGFTITTAAAIFSPSVPDAYADVLIAISAFITNVMATRVYRQLKLGILHEQYTTGQITTPVFRLRTGEDANVNAEQEQREGRAIELGDIQVGRSGRDTEGKTEGL